MFLPVSWPGSSSRNIVAPITGEFAAVNTEWTAPQWGGLEFYLTACSEWEGEGAVGGLGGAAVLNLPRSQAGP